MAVQKTDNIALPPIFLAKGEAESKLDEKQLAEAGKNLAVEISIEGAKQKQAILNEGIENQAERNSSDAKETEHTRRTDKAELSEESKFSQLTPEQIAKMMRAWTLEAEKELWNLLMNWTVKTDSSLSDVIKELASVYQRLFDSVLANTTGMNQEVQLERLDRALSTACNQLIKSTMKELAPFLERYGTPEEVFALKSSIYKQITGHTLPPDKMEQFWNAYAAPAGCERDVSGRMKQGTIYQPGSKGRVLVDRQFEGDKGARASESKAFDFKTAGSKTDGSKTAGFKTPDFKTSDFKTADIKASELKRSSPEHSSRMPGVKNHAETYVRNTRYGTDALKTALYTPKDMEQAEPFVRYIEGKGNLLAGKQAEGGSEELAGVMAAVMAVKTQTFVAVSPVSASMGLTVRSAVERMIDYYIVRLSQKEGAAEYKQTGKEAAAFDCKEVYRVYHHIMSLYQAEGRAASAVSKGILYAFRLFYKKKEDPCYQSLARYNKERGFFQKKGREVSLTEGNSYEAEWNAGKKLFNQDWNEFQRTLGCLGRQELPLELVEQSPWGIMAAPEDTAALPAKKIRGVWVTVWVILSVSVILALLIWAFR